MAKKSNNNQQQQGEILAVDVGYGYTQALSSSGKADIQPSAYTRVPAGLAGDELAGVQAALPGLTLYELNQALFVGDLALKQVAHTDELISLEGRSNSETGHEFRARMLRMVASRFFAGDTSGGAVHVAIATGLPVDFLGDRPMLQATLEGQHRVLSDSTDIVLNVTQAIIMPQSLGTVYSYILNPDGGAADFDGDYILALDFGTYTAQVVSYERGMGLNRQQSFSVAAGASLIRNEIYDALDAEEATREMPLARVDEAIRTGDLKVRGEYRDYSGHRQRGVEAIWQRVQARLAARVDAALGTDIVLISGGIAPLMLDYVQAYFGQSRVFVVDNPQWGNVSGYMRYAQRKINTISIL